MQTSAAQLARRVERWQKLLSPLGIGHYRITAVHLVDQTPSGHRANATVWVPDDYDNAEFWFQDTYVNECTEQELDETVIHEWLHVAMRDFDGALRAVESWMPDQTFQDFEESVDHAREGFIERLARALYDFYTN